MGWKARKYRAMNAVDGNTDPIMGHKHCAYAEAGSQDGYSWRVDLKDLYKIEKITLYGTHGEYIKCRQ